MSSCLFPSRLRLLRLRCGLSQKQLAQRLHFGPSAISNYENGRTEPSFLVLFTLADFFQVSTDYLLGHDRPFSASLPAQADRLLLLFSLCSPQEQEVLFQLLSLLQEKQNKKTPPVSHN